MMLGLILYAGVVLALLGAELRGNQAAQNVFKPLAALGFIGLALYNGALDSLYGNLILSGLVACALGDVLLLARKSEKLFMAGMAAFALGHGLYSAAFLKNAEIAWGAASPLVYFGPVVLAIGVFFYVRPHLEREMKVAVFVYSAIICVMVISAFHLPKTGTLVYAVPAALMFAMSDIFVARDRFVKPSPMNALAITPLYFGAQALFALSV